MIIKIYFTAKLSCIDNRGTMLFSFPAVKTHTLGRKRCLPGQSHCSKKRMQQWNDINREGPSTSSKSYQLGRSSWPIISCIHVSNWSICTPVIQCWHYWSSVHGVPIGSLVGLFVQGLQALMSLKCMKFIFVGSNFTRGTRKERSSSVQKTLTTYLHSYQ